MSKTLSTAFVLRLLAGLVLIAGIVFCASRDAGASAGGTTDAAEHGPYTELSPPLGTDNANKIEVMEFFWYGCPHCYSLEPAINAWLAKLPKDVEFKRVPAAPNEVWRAAARAYYALEAMGLQPKMHKALFDAVQNDRLRLTNTQQLDDWLSRQNIDVAKFHAAENSFSVEGRLKRSAQLFDQSGSDGVPAMVIDGRYLVEMSQNQTPERMMQTVDALIEKARKLRAEKAAAAKK